MTEFQHKSPLQIESFEDDLLGMEAFCRVFEEYLFIDHDFVKGSLVVSLNAAFGSGKSTLLKMWENDLQNRRNEEKGDAAENGIETPLVISLNAWESDFYGEPLIPIISELVEKIEKDLHLSAQSNQVQKLKSGAKTAARFALGLANSVVRGAFQVDAIEAGKYAVQPEETNLLQDYRGRRDALENLKKLLAETLGGDRPKAFVFIDELDRCRPDYAVSYLETIKHVFDIHGMVFVLAVDYDHLGNSARSLYGSDLKFPEYFRKFVQRSFELPEPPENRRPRFYQELTTFYLDDQQLRFTRFDQSNVRENIPELLKCFRPTARQTVDFFRILGHLSSVPERPKGPMYVGYGLGMALMVCLKVSEKNVYHEIGNGGRSDTKILTLFHKAFGDTDEGRWWAGVYLGGFEEIRETPQIMRTAGFFLPENDEGESLNSLIHSQHNLWGPHTQDRYPQFYRMIESISPEYRR